MAKASRENGWDEYTGAVGIRCTFLSTTRGLFSLSFQRTSPGDLSGWAINPGFVENLALCRNPRIGNGGIGGLRGFAGFGGGVRGYGGVDYGP
uniref:Uncharacterized protein n=1 Tax=Fagus sylvatica TaxID=28930 RepID=A0A2N9HRQ2_FAGSY